MSLSRSTDEAVFAARSFFPESDITAILDSIAGVLRSGRLILGEHTAAFEDAFKSYIGTEHAVSVNSCSTALQICMRFFGVDKREVILPANNFPGVVSAVQYEGGIPILADIDAQTFCMDTGDALRRITPRTAGIVVLHLAGLVHPDIDRLRQFCDDRGLFLIEDAAHAHGASIGGRKAGSLGHAGCFSFYPTKIMTTGTGGMITTQNEKLAAFARLLRHHGQGVRRDEFLQPGSDWCLSEIHAILGLQQLARVEESVAHRNQLVTWYREELAAADWITVPRYSTELRHAYYKLPTLVSETVNRNLLRDRLENEFGIQNGAIYDPPCHLQPAFRATLGYQPGDYPIAERTLARQLCPPVHAQVTRQQVEYVVRTMNRIIDECRFRRGTPGG